MSAFGPDGLRRLHDAMARRIADREFPGVVILLARDDEVHVDALGEFGFDSGRPMRRDTLFRIASLTKPVVAAATLMLIDAGVIDLNEPVDRLLPELADRTVLRRIDGPLNDLLPARRPITVEDLLSFRLGFGHITEPTFDPAYPIITATKWLNLVLAQPDPRTPHPPDVWMRLFGMLPLMEQPGERWRYNVGSLLQGVLVARAAGAALGDVLADRIFRPLDMVDTGFSTNAAGAQRMPDYYMADPDSGQQVMQPVSMPAEWTAPPVFPSGSAGLLSTVDDYLAFARMLLDNGGTLLSATSVAAMTTNQLTPTQVETAGVLLDGNGWGYGVAVALPGGQNGVTPGQYGWSGGYGTTWFNDPSRGLIAIAMTQTSDFLWSGARAEFDRLAVDAVA